MKSSKTPGNAPRKPTASPARLRIQSILATTDFSKESLSGVRYAVALAEKVGAAVALLHVVEFPTPPAMPGMRTVTRSLQDSKFVNRPRARLKTLAKRESKDDLNVTPILHSGNSFYGIITTARERATDLIVLATHGYSGVKRVLLGSTAERVVRHSPCPVLTVPARPRRTGKRPFAHLKKILVPIDFSKASGSALPWANSLAESFNAELILLHVVEEFPIDYILGRGLMNEMIARLMKQAEAGLNGMAENLSKTSLTDVSTAVRYGKPFKEICRVAKSLGADLIALTTHGYTGLKHFYLGSTAERVVRHASGPVLVVRELNRRKL
jgi:nucleotide-binding universal stress UspA family protein